MEKKNLKTMTVHEMAVLMEIYKDCPNYNLVLWDPYRQQHERIYFTGSSHPDKSVNFNTADIDKDESKLWGFDMIEEQLLAEHNFYIITMPHKDLSGFWFNISYLEGDEWKEASDEKDYQKYEDAKKAGLKFARSIYNKMLKDNAGE